MSVQAISWALKQDLPTATKFVLVALCNYAAEDGVCWPSQERLASDTGMTERTVRTHLKRLEDDGVIARKARWKEKGSRSSDMIWIHMEANRNEIPVSPTIPETDDNHTGNSRPTIPERDSGEPSLEPSIEPSENPPVSPLPKKSVGKRTPVPPDWMPDERSREYAAERGNTDEQIQDLAEQFRDHHAGKGTLFADIPAGWRTWVRNDIKFNGEPNGRGGRQRPDSDVSAFARAQVALETLPADDIRRRV